MISNKEIHDNCLSEILVNCETSLSNREQKIFENIYRSLQKPWDDQLLNISKYTANFYLRNMVQKLKVNREKLTRN